MNRASIAPAVVTVAVVALVGAVQITTRHVPAELWGVLWTVIGGYFGSAVPAHRIDPVMPEPLARPGDPTQDPRHAAR